MGPLAKTGIVSEAANLWLAVVIGFVFGFVLQRLGFTHGTKIGRVFYLRDVDVMVGMFTAIVTAALGLWGLALLGAIDTSRFYFLPTYLAPMAVGGLIFGVGMVVGGYCPGTSLASAVTGKIDALVFLLGFLIGTLLFGDLFQVWGEFYHADFRGVLRIDELFGWPLGATVLALTLVAAAFVWGVLKLQRRFWGAGAVCAISPADRIPAGVALALALVIAFFPTEDFFASGEAVGSVAGWDHPMARTPAYLDALGVGRLLYDNADRAECIDLRPARAFAASHLPGAVNTDLEGIARMDQVPGTVALVIGDDPGRTRRALEILWRYKQVRAYAARSGYAELKALYLDPPTPDAIADLTPKQREELETYRAFPSCNPP